jgi:hypothetical protein
MTRAEFESKSFEEVMEQLSTEQDNIWTYEQLKEVAKEHIDRDNLNVAAHILNAMWNDSQDWYNYDYNMGTLDTPVSIMEKVDVEHMIDD